MSYQNIFCTAFFKSINALLQGQHNNDYVVIHTDITEICHILQLFKLLPWICIESYILQQTQNDVWLLHKHQEKKKQFQKTKYISYKIQYAGCWIFINIHYTYITHHIIRKISSFSNLFYANSLQIIGNNRPYGSK